MAGGYTAGAVGESFVLFIATLLGIPFEQLALSVVVKSTVHHAEFNLSEEEQAQFVGKAVQESGVADVTNFLGNVLEARNIFDGSGLRAIRASSEIASRLTSNRVCFIAPKGNPFDTLLVQRVRGSRRERRFK